MKHIVVDARIRRSSTGRYVDRLVEHLQLIDQVHRYSVLVHPDDPWKPKNKNFARVEAPWPQFSLNPLHQVKFARLLYKLRADIVHFPMNQQPLFYLKPVVTSVMDLTMLRFTRPGRRSRAVHEVRMVAYRFLFWYSLLKSKAIITISNFVKQDLVNNYPFIKKKPITVTYCASEPPLKAIASPPSGIQKPFIIHVGSPFPHKNIDRLVDAFGLLKQTQPDLKLVLVGKIEHYFEQLQIYINSTPHKDDIIVTGFVSDEALKWLYQNAEAYALPSLSEGFGLPGLEAMAHGCPVASSNATCLPEVYGDAVVYFDPENAQDMADKIGQVISNKTLGKELVQKGYEQLKKYSWERMANQTLEVYNKTLDS